MIFTAGYKNSKMNTMTSRDTCIFYRSMYEAIKELPKGVQADVYDAIFSYSLDFEKKELTGIARTIWLLIEPVLTKGNTNFINGKQPKQKQITSETEAKPKRLFSESGAYKDKDEYEDKDVDIYTSDPIESNPVKIQPDSIQLHNSSIEKKKVPQKKKDHRFADSIYADDPDLFIEHWNKTETARTHPDTDPLKVYTTLKTSSDASSKYKYANWISAAQNWVKRNPAEYKRTYTTANGHQLHHNDQAILDRVDRLTRNTFGG
jgi:hypothetical protein